METVYGGSSNVSPKKRKRRANMESRYFAPPSPKRKKTQAIVTDLGPLLTDISPCTTHSRYFRKEADLNALAANPAFMLFYEDVVASLIELRHAKPILIQEHVSSDPWKVLVAVTLLNKTAGEKSIPVFFDIMEQWPSPVSLTEAPFSCLYELIKDLGLGETRSQRLIDISQTFLSDPPVVDRPRPSRGKTTALRLSLTDSAQIVEVKYPPTPISHIPGCGPYALDSYRIFCAGGDTWKSVRPRDKELIRYLKWRWAAEEYREWDPMFGPGDTVSLEYIRRLTLSLESHHIFHC